MEASTVWKFLHIASMFLAVSIFVGQGMLSGVVARSGDVAAVRRVMAAEEVGPIVIRAIRANRFHVLTHPRARSLVEGRFAAMLEDFDFAARTESA